MSYGKKRKGNPQALIKAIGKNPRMSSASKAKAIKTLKSKYRIK